MRLSALFLFLAIAAPAFADQPAEAGLFAERRALLAADARCSLLTADERAALAAGAGQARGGLLRAGWTSDRADRLAARADAAGAARPCADPVLVKSVSQAKAGYAAWSRIHAMAFAGASAVWHARRTPDPKGGWRLWQDAPDAAARFGVRERPGGEELAFVAPPTPRGWASATLYVRDVARAPLPLVEVPGRPKGLAGGAPARGVARVFPARSRVTEPSGLTSFLFPETALAAALRIDPREAIEIELDDRDPQTPPRRVLFEAGDLAAARAFLAARPAS
jgi:hypothetical protein